MSENSATSIFESDEGESSLSDEFFIVGDYVNLVFACFGAAMELLLLIHFCILIFTKTEWSFMGFSILLSCGYITDLVAQFLWVMSLLPGGEAWTNATELSYIYCIASGGIWNVILALNRCTAVLFPTKYSRIWSTKMIYFYCIFMLLFPCAIQGHTVFDERFPIEGLALDSSTTNFLLINRAILGISNTILSFIALLTTTIVYAKNRKPNSTSRGWEVKLLLNCAFTSLFMIIFSVLFLAAALFQKNPEMELLAFIFEYLSIFMWNTFHYGGIVTLLIVNKPIRKSYFHFCTSGRWKEASSLATIPSNSGFKTLQSSKAPNHSTSNQIFHR